MTSRWKPSNRSHGIVPVRLGRRVLAQRSGARAIALGRLSPAAHLPRLAAAGAGNLERNVHLGVDRMVGRLESEDQQGLTGRARVREGRLRLVEEAAVGRIEPGLRQLPDRLGTAREGI